MLRSVCARSLNVNVSGARSFSSMRSTNFNGRFVQQRTNKDFNWQKLITNFTPPSVTARFKAIDAELNALRMELKGAPASIPPIDWSHWEKVINDKAAVSALKNEYENTKFELGKGLDLTSINAKLDAAIERTQSNVPISLGEIGRYKEKLEQVYIEKNLCAFWSLEDYFDRYPGLEKQLNDDWEEGYQLPTDTQDRLEAIDVAAIRTAYDKGQPIVLEDGLADRIGDFVFQDERKRLQNINDKMFAGSKIYDEFRATRVAEEKKIEAAKEAARKAHEDHEEHH